MRRLDKLIAEAVEKLPEDLVPKVVVFGSAPLALEGVRIREDIEDLDLFVSDDVFDELQRRGLHSRLKLRDAKTDGEVHHIVLVGSDDDPDVEVLKTFQGVAFAEVFANALEHPSGFRMGALDDVRRWKVASGRPKDLNDIAAIDRFLNR